MTIALEPSASAAGERWREGEYDLIYQGTAAFAGIAADELTVVQRAPGGMTVYRRAEAAVG